MEYHIRCDPKDISRYCFVPGSHDRAKMIAAHLKDVKTVSESRGYLVYTGTWEGIRMTVSSTGMGGPSTAIAVEELGHMGADTFIRVGSCGTMQEYIECGGVIIASGTFRAGGTGNNYLPLAFPAVPNFEVTSAMANAAKKLNIKAYVGLGSAGDSFYAPRNTEQRSVLKNSGLIFGEMESDTLFIVAAVRGFRAGALFTTDGTAKETKPEWGEKAFHDGEENAIVIALEAMKTIAIADQSQ